MPNAIPILAGRISAQELNSLKEYTGWTVVRLEFADIREKPSPRGPSLDQGTSAELDRSDRASAPILQIIAPP